MRLNLRTTSFCILAASVIIQLILVWWVDDVQTSDAAANLRLANDCLNSGNMYPFDIHRYGQYIYANGFINLAIVLMSIFGSVKAVFVANTIMLLVTALSVAYISKRYFSERVAYIFLIIFALYPTNYGMTVWFMTEPMFMMLTYLAFAFFVKGGKRGIILSGILLALMNWTRPFLPVFIVIIPLTAFLLNRDIWIRKSALCFGSLLISILVIGSIHKATFGDFLYQPSTGGVNMIMGSNDEATGGYDDAAFRDEGIAVLPSENLTYAERDKFWKSQSVEWIKHNPAKWVLLIPKKLKHLYLHDVYSLAPLSGSMSTFFTIPEHLLGGLVRSFPFYTPFQLVIVWNCVLYSILLLLSLIAVVIFVLQRDKMGLILTTWIVLTTGISIITVGAARYHYPLMPIFILMGAFMIDRIINKLNTKRL
ncbi:MAG: hypothetical protein SNJ09_04970 [Rikenellaceae bacterium]